MTKKRSESSRRWLARQAKDVYVQKAKAEGHRSRAAYKLLEVQKKYDFIRPGMRIVDLGAAPGGWSLVARDLVKSSGKVFALDCLPMDPIDGVQFIQGDFTQDNTLEALLDTLSSGKVDGVICDMAPNMSGVRAVDIPKSHGLVELALDFCLQMLKPKGFFFVKVFQGDGIEAIFQEMKKHFGKIIRIKPEASRQASRELYVLATDFKPYCK